MSRRKLGYNGDDVPMDQVTQNSDEQPDLSPDAPTKQERLDFLKQAIAFTEWTIRSFDTKAQISIAAFVLSINPLWSILSSACPHAASTVPVAILILLLLTSVLLFGYVIWPVKLGRPQLAGGWQNSGLFYVADPEHLTASTYLDRLNGLAVEAELAAETLKLAYIRDIKSRRFKNALLSVALFYAWTAACFLLARNCGAGG